MLSTSLYTLVTTELVSEEDLGNTGMESSDDTVDPVGDKIPPAPETPAVEPAETENLSLLWLKSQLGDRGMGTGLSLEESWSGDCTLLQLCMLSLCCRLAL